MIKQKSDFLSGCTLILVSAYLMFSKNIALGRTLGIMPAIASAETYVRALGGIMGFLAILLVIRSFISDKSTTKGSIPKEVVLTGIALLVYVLLLKPVGFFLASVILIAFLTFIYRIKEKHISRNDSFTILKSVGVSVVYSLICVGILQYIFTSLLGARLP